MNWVAAILLLPAVSVNLLAATSMVVAPDADGLNVALNNVELVAVKLLIVPPDTVMSPNAKLEIASLEVNVTTSESSLVVAPSATILEPLVALIAIVGATLS